ncbi:MAG: hypothetical protein MKZ76_03400 [Pedosphaera sp.]|nr:hypothetical protein [Pedosphaera sp.]
MKFFLLFLGLTLSLSGAPKQLLVLGQKPDGHPPGTHEYMPESESLVWSRTSFVQRSRKHPGV